MNLISVLKIIWWRLNPLPDPDIKTINVVQT